MTQKIDRIFLVDDSYDEVFITKILFERQRVGPELVAFHQLDALYESVGREDFAPERSLLVLDMNLTLAKGTDGVAHLRTLNAAKNSVMGICSGSEDPADIEQAAAAGADFFVGKPLDRSRLSAICDAVPRLSARQDAGGMLQMVMG